MKHNVVENSTQVFNLAVLLMSLKVIYFQSIFLIDFYIKKTDLYAGIWNNFTKLVCSREFKRKQKLQ